MGFINGVGINREKSNLLKYFNSKGNSAVLSPLTSYFCFSSGFPTLLKPSLQQPSFEISNTYIHAVELIPQYFNSTFSSILPLIKTAGNSFPQFVPEQLRIRPGPIRGAP